MLPSQWDGSEVYCFCGKKVTKVQHEVFDQNKNKTCVNGPWVADNLFNIIFMK